jgi:bacteriorhodopsin
MNYILPADDYVGISFWLISMALVAATAFFFIERDRVAGKWKTSLTVSGLVTLIAAVHYFYMREVWVSTGESPTAFRYIDWLLTVPLLMIEFYLILTAVAKVPGGVFWRLLVGSVVMLGFGFAGETGMMDVQLAFWPAMAAWSGSRISRRVRGGVRASWGHGNTVGQWLLRGTTGGAASN